MRRSLFTLTAIALIVAVLAVSCVPQSSKTLNEDEHAFVWFGFLEAKAVNEEVYSTHTSDGAITSANVAARSADSMYWAYKAVKTDDGFSYGATGNAAYADVSDTYGLNKAKEFSKGTWNFELVGYTTSTDRTNQKNAVYRGSVSNYAVSSNGQSITIPVDYAYSDGYGTANFSITASLTQDPLASNITIDNYTITGVKAKIGEKSTNLTLQNGVWKGTINNVPFGMPTASFEVYVADEAEPRAVKSSRAVIMTNMETNIVGTASINLVKNTATATFVVGETTDQPAIYAVFYDPNGGTLASGMPEYCRLGETITPPAPSKYGLEFKGWKVSNTADSTASKSYTASSANNVTLVAVWETPAVGGTLTMGTYPAKFVDSNSGNSASAGDYAGKPVTWKVLAVDTTANKALVISEYVLTAEKHQITANSSNPYTWSNSLIRTWLNNTGSDGFISQYGLSSVSIAEVTHDTDLNGSTESTIDKVFLLSVSEANSYFADNSARVANTLADSAAIWWLRSRGSYDSFSAAFVRNYGRVIADGYYADYLNGVRPAFWINL